MNYNSTIYFEIDFKNDKFIGFTCCFNLNHSQYFNSKSYSFNVKDEPLYYKNLQIEF